MRLAHHLGCGLVFALAATTAAVAQEPPRRTAIDDYVQAPDDAYRWKVVSTAEEDGLTTVVVDMTSQRWLTRKEVDRTAWQHWLTLVIPEDVTAKTALLYISGGNNGGDAPTKASERVRLIAEATGTVVAEVNMVPNQPLVFADDGEQRYEDNLIGYGWNRFLDTGDTRWLARGPMVKSAVRAMDTVTAVMASKTGGKREVDRFVVAGASKRGWTAWLTGAMDERVVALIPIVIDVLDVKASMRHHFAAYGYWAPAIGDYFRHGIMQRLTDPRLDALYELVDPISYSHRLTMPKLVLNAAGDEFFLPDSAQFYWRQLRGENYLRYVPNTNHGMAGADALETVIAFHSLIVQGKKPPQFSWRRNEEGGLDLLTVDAPEAVRLFAANNPEARDFRLQTLGAEYGMTPVEPKENMSFSSAYNLQPPESGWTAWFLELVYDVGAPHPLRLTTEVLVTPPTLPFADKPSDLPPSLTAVCPAADEDAAKGIAEAAADAPVPVAAAQVIGTRAFINWPPGEDMVASVGAMFEYLREQPCETVLLQLESGPEMTLPPVVQTDSEETSAQVDSEES